MPKDHEDFASALGGGQKTSSSSIETFGNPWPHDKQVFIINKT